MLHGLFTAQVIKTVLVNVNFDTCRTVAVQRLLKPGLGKLGDALEVFQGSSQFFIGPTTTFLAGSQRPAQP